MVKGVLDKLFGNKKASIIVELEERNSYETIEDFRSRIIEEFSTYDEVIELNPDETDELVIIVKMDSDNIHQVYIGNLAGRIEGLSYEEAEKVISKFVADIVSHGFGSEKVDIDSVFANIRPLAYFEHDEGIQDKILCETFIADIFIMYQENTSTGLSSIDNDDEVISQAVPDIKTHAISNLENLMDNLEIVNNEDANKKQIISRNFYLEDYETLSPGLLLSDTFKKVLADIYPNGSYIIIPSTDCIVAVSKEAENPLEVARNIISDAFQDGADQLSEYVFEVIDNELKVVSEAIN